MSRQYEGELCLLSAGWYARGGKRCADEHTVQGNDRSVCGNLFHRSVLSQSVQRFLCRPLEFQRVLMRTSHVSSDKPPKRVVALTRVCVSCVRRKPGRKRESKQMHSRSELLQPQHNCVRNANAISIICSLNYNAVGNIHCETPFAVCAALSHKNKLKLDAAVKEKKKKSVQHAPWAKGQW